jgi:hypothetical protein
MCRSTVRLVAVVILALLGAPVALHVVLHDLHGHEGEAAATAGIGDHESHEHPVVSSDAPEAVPPVVRLAAVVITAVPATSRHAGRTERNVLAHGAVRTDDDVGLLPFLSTFLI